MNLIRVQAIPLLSNVGLYAANDCVGSGILTFNYALTGSSKEGLIKGITVVDQANQKTAGTLVLFDEDVSATSPIVDNAAFDCADADMSKIVAAIPIPAANYVSFADNAIATVQCEYPFKQNKGTNNIFGVFVTLGTPTYVALNDIIINLNIQRMV